MLVALAGIQGRCGSERAVSMSDRIHRRCHGVLKPTLGCSNLYLSRRFVRFEPGYLPRMLSHEQQVEILQ